MYLKMKVCIEKLKDNLQPIIQIVFMIASLFLPTIVNVTDWIQFFFQNTEINFETAKYYFLLKAGNWGIGIILMFFVLFKIRKVNTDKLFNTRNVYHNYPYIWYFVCAKILGFTKCNLKLVPIFMQFKLVLNDTFAEYNVGSEDDYPIIEEEEIVVRKVNWTSGKEVNLVLADTYPIVATQIPNSKSVFPTLFIMRKRPDQSRYYSPKFIAKIVDEVRNLPKDMTIVNVFPTTNAKHTKKIAGDAFKLADRGNVKKLVIFPQDNKGERKFEEKEKIIYNYR